MRRFGTGSVAPNELWTGRECVSTRVSALATALAEQGIDPASIATGRGSLQVEALDPPQSGSGERVAIAAVVVILLYFQLITFGAAGPWCHGRRRSTR